MNTWRAGSIARRLLLAAIAALALVGCIGQGGGTTMQLRSDAFGEGEQIPVKYTCDGTNVSPPLTWSGAPEDAEAFALLVTDPDAQNFVHWAVADIPKVNHEVEEGASGADLGGVEATNGFGKPGWGGPCPPSGSHRYVFTVYALSSTLDLGEAPDAAALHDALEGKVLAQGQLSGQYARQSH